MQGGGHVKFIERSQSRSKSKEEASQSRAERELGEYRSKESMMWSNRSAIQGAKAGVDHS
jgi:hypothetical protein